MSNILRIGADTIPISNNFFPALNCTASLYKSDSNGSQVVIQYPESRRRDFYVDYDDGYDPRGYDGSYYHQNVRSYQNGYSNGYRGRNGGGRR